jgi:hypothetical protein
VGVYIRNAKKSFTAKLLAMCAAILAFVSNPAIAQPQQENQLQPQGLAAAGIYQLKQTDPNLNGSGINVAVISRSNTYIDGQPQNDYRPAIGHNCFKDTQFNFYDPYQPAAAGSQHTTAICSILLGSEPNAFTAELGQFDYQGIVPQAKADVYELWYFLSNNVYSQIPPDADIITASTGSQTEDWWTRGIDSLVENYGLVVVASIGNGSDSYDPPLYPAASANVIGVGVVNSVNSPDATTRLSNFALPYPQHSSLGPTLDGRCKPDIVTVGNCLTADINDPTGYKATNDWTSFSTPIVAGTIGLLMQKAKQVPELNAAIAPQGGNCVMKAILLNSAKKLPYWHKGRLQKDDDHTVPLDYVQGAGMLNTLEAYKQLISKMDMKDGDISNVGWDNDVLNEAESGQNVYSIKLTQPANKMITVTAAWNKHYESKYPFDAKPQEDSNLRLELWAVDPENANNNYLLDYSDSNTDNVEHIYCSADANYTDYKIVIRYSDISDPGQAANQQRYGLAWNVSDKPADNILWYDLNADGIVDEMDINIMLENMIESLETPKSYFIGDINNDGKIDVNDLDILIKHQDNKADWYIE